ncbi:MAG: 3-phosphoshikimate 1-carboxyvinyltransferase [Tannerella sp.]|jgi:3-phosphoshikimate 1-carboxyvinyltransferase|nr:3-phosphoshikimate 1-carboxyvinyltransferase [Tannerella sp.]
MDYLIKTQGFRAVSIKLPASKSISNRVLILNALSCASQSVQNLADCDDTNVMLKALQSSEHEIDIKAAGTAMRFLTAYLAGRPGNRTITGTERMKNRPVKILVDALNSLGAQIEYVDKEGFPPLRIIGNRLVGGETSLYGGVSSQYISALLMAAPLMEKGLRLHLTGRVISRPYLDLTIRLMKEFGVTVFEDGHTLTIPPQSYVPVPFTVESDWSAASYWYEIVALSDDARVSLSGLFADSMQGDAGIVYLFDKLGVETIFETDGVVLRRKERSVDMPFTQDFTDMPDMAQTFAVTCAVLGIPFILSGLQSLKIKETDRLAALCNELSKLGYLLTEEDGQILRWNGELTAPAQVPVIQTYDDHRMAMAFAPIALRRPEGITLANIEVVSKSYPLFWKDLQKADFKLISMA